MACLVPRQRKECAGHCGMPAEVEVLEGTVAGSEGARGKKHGEDLA